MSNSRDLLDLNCCHCLVWARNERHFRVLSTVSKIVFKINLFWCKTKFCAKRVRPLIMAIFERKRYFGKQRFYILAEQRIMKCDDLYKDGFADKGFGASRRVTLVLVRWCSAASTKASTSDSFPDQKPSGQRQVNPLRRKIFKRVNFWFDQLKNQVIFCSKSCPHTLNFIWKYFIFENLEYPNFYDFWNFKLRFFFEKY